MLYPIEAPFGLAFYRALLETGQADFALTEGRRSVMNAAREVLVLPQTETGQPTDVNELAMIHALSYVSYQSASARSLFDAPLAKAGSGVA